MVTKTSKQKTFDVYLLAHPLFYLGYFFRLADPAHLNAVARYAVKYSLGVWGNRIREIAPQIKSGKGTLVLALPPFDQYEQGSFQSLLKRELDRFVRFAKKQVGSKNITILWSADNQLPAWAKKRVSNAIRKSTARQVRVHAEGEIRDQCPHIMGADLYQTLARLHPGVSLKLLEHRQRSFSWVPEGGVRAGIRFQGVRKERRAAQKRKTTVFKPRIKRG